MSRANKRTRTEDAATKDETPKKNAKTKGSQSNGAHIRDKILPKPLPEGQNFIKIISWNVNGLSAVMKSKKDIFLNLVEKHKPDILCLQETKLQEKYVDDYRDVLDGYESFWSCSTVKAGYSGTAIFLKKSSISLNAVGTSTSDGSSAIANKPKQKTLSSFWSGNSSKSKSEKSQNTSISSTALCNVSSICYDFEDQEKKFDGEGRTITIEFDKFILVACYVPNSGDGLKRLSYRVNEWDPFVRNYLNKHAATKPVVFTGDLNVGHLNLDIHNPWAKHITQQAGLTPQERNSMGVLLNTNFMDAFRFLYPDARGQFTYWSQRTFARPVNKGIRLDYFVCSRDMFTPSADESQKSDDVVEDSIGDAEGGPLGCGPSGESERDEICLQHTIINDIPTPGVFDSYIIHADTVGCSDHCPVVLVVKL